MVGRTKVRIAALGLVVTGAVAGGLLLLGGEGDDGEDVAGTDDGGVPVSLPPVTTLPPDDEGAEVLELLVAGRDLHFHATYASSGGTDSYELELYRRGGRTRQDVVSADGAFHTVGIYDAGESTVCTLEQGAEGPAFVCSTAPADETAADGIFGSVLGDLAGVDVTVTDETIADRAVRCFTSDGDDGPSSLCLTTEGLPVRATTPTGDLTLTAYEESVDESVFEPPAEPVGAVGEDT